MTRVPFSQRPVDKAPGHWVLARAGKKVLRPGGLALSTWALKRAGIPGAHVVVRASEAGGIVVSLEDGQMVRIEDTQASGIIVRG